MIEKTWKSKTTAKKYASLKKDFKYKELLISANLKRGQKVVDLCCGSGDLFLGIRKEVGHEGEIVGIDFSKHMLEKAKSAAIENNVKLILGNAENLHEIIKEEVDRVVCNIAMFYLEIPKAMQSISKILKKKGLLVFNMKQASFQVKNEDQRWLAFNKSLRRAVKETIKKKKMSLKVAPPSKKYTLKQIKDWLEKAGFRLKKYFEVKRNVKPGYRLDTWIKVPALSEQFLPGSSLHVRTKILKEAKNKVLKEIGTKPFSQTMAYFVAEKR